MIICLASIKAVTASYPLRGELKIVNSQGIKIKHFGSPEPGNIWIERKVSRNFRVNGVG